MVVFCKPDNLKMVLWEMRGLVVATHMQPPLRAIGTPIKMLLLKPTVGQDG